MPASKTSGHRHPQPVVDASFALHVAASPAAVGGRGRLAIAWPRIPQSRHQAAAGNNPPDRAAPRADRRLLKLDLDAHQTGPLRPRRRGARALGAGWHAPGPRLAGTCTPPGSAWPGHGRLQRPGHERSLGSEPGAHCTSTCASPASTPPANRAAAARRLRAGKQSGAPPDGQRRPHGQHHLAWRAEGGWGCWGNVAGPAGRRRPEQPRHRAIQFARPGPPSRWRPAHGKIGPLRLAGNPLDWQATWKPRPTTGN